MAAVRPLGCELYESFLKECLHHEIPPCQEANPNKASNGSLVRVEKIFPLKALRYHAQKRFGMDDDSW